MILLLKLKLGIRRFLGMSLLIRDVLLLEFWVSRELLLIILILFLLNLQAQLSDEFNQILQ